MVKIHVNQYEDRDIENQEFFARHVNAMKFENLKQVVCVAAELAHRDQIIKELKGIVEKSRNDFLTMSYHTSVKGDLKDKMKLEANELENYIDGF